MADKSLYLRFLVISICCHTSFCGRFKSLLVITDSVFQNFACEVRIEMENFEICMATCKALESCYGVNYHSNECVLGFKNKNDANNYCNSWTKKTGWTHAVKGLVYMNIVSIQFLWTAASLSFSFSMLVWYILHALSAIKKATLSSGLKSF